MDRRIIVADKSAKLELGGKTYEYPVLEGSIGILPRRLMVRDQDLFMARQVLSDNDIPTGL